jgi:hypothetical protein
MDMKTPTIGSLIDKLFGVREKRRALAKEDEALAKEVEQLTADILAQLDAQGMDKASSKKATASISHVTVANVTDWDKFHAFVKKTGFFHLLQRRVSDPSYREVVEIASTDKKMAKALAEAGVEPFVKTNLNLRAL